MKEEISELDVVALTEDVPGQGLVSGQVGTVVEVHEDGVSEVEFCDDAGKAYAMLSMKKEQLMVLHYAPVPAI